MSRVVRIGIDARELLGETTGVGRYLGELLRRWTTRGDASVRRLILYSPEPLKISFPEELTESRVIPGAGGTWWEQTALRRAVGHDRPDVFFAPAYTAPLGLGMPLAVTIHDVSFLAHPEWFRPRERWRRRVLTRRTASRAAVVFTDSEFSRSEIASHLRVESDRLVTIPPGIALPALQRAKGTKREPLVLYVGSLFNRRRLPDLIAAFGKMAATRPDARLVIVGADRTWPKQDLQVLAAQEGADRIQILNYVTEDELRALYSRAAVFGFLSEYEGFGLTPLEALSAGVPIVVLDTPVAREVYGAAAEYVQRGDIEGTAAALDGFLRSPDAGRAQLVRAAAVLERYDWTCAADATLERIEAIAR